jgi:hypothetical protein
MRIVQAKIVSVIFMMIMALAPLAAAEDYKIDYYDFRWEVDWAGNVGLFIQKTQEGVWAMLNSPGGRLGSVRLTPAQAKSVGDTLLKSEEYHASFMEKTMESSQTVPAGDVYVTFSAKRKGVDFHVLVHLEKIIKNAARFKKEEALEMGKLLQDVEAKAAYADKRIKP